MLLWLDKLLNSLFFSLIDLLLLPLLLLFSLLLLLLLLLLFSLLLLLLLLLLTFTLVPVPVPVRLPTKFKKKIGQIKFLKNKSEIPKKKVSEHHYCKHFCRNLLLFIKLRNEMFFKLSLYKQNCIIWNKRLLNDTLRN